MAENEATSPENAPRLSLKTQYIRDLSFENPNAPAIFATLGEAPKVDLNLDLDGQKMADDHFELAIQITVRTSTEKTMFITELTYAGLFEVANIPEEHIEQILMVDCAMMLFPFARRVIADITRDGGYPPLLLEPVDFYGLYMQRKQQAEGESEAS